MKKEKKRKESVKSKRIQNFSSQEVDMKKKKKPESITLNQKRYREGVRDVKFYIYIYIYPKLLEEVDMKKKKKKRSRP